MFQLYEAGIFCYSFQEISHPPFVKGIIKQVLLATCVIGAPTSVFAYPFNPDPQSFQNYMNTRSWKSGSKAYFQNLNSCGGADATFFYCSGGFVTISSPMGTKVCEISSANWSRDLIKNKGSFSYSYSQEGGKVSYRIGSCRYK